MVNALSLADFERRNQLVGLLIQVASEFPSVFSSPPITTSRKCQDIVSSTLHLLELNVKVS